MRIVDILRLSTRMFKTNKLRTILTILGISVGIAAILFLVSLGMGLQNVLISQIAASMLSVDVEPVSSASLIKLDKDRVRDIEALNGVDEVSPVYEVSAMMKSENSTGAVFVDLVRVSFFKLGGIKTMNNKFFTENTDNKIIVSKSALQLFNLTPENAIGKTAQLDLYMPKINDDNDKGEIIQTEEVEAATLNKTYEIIDIIDDNTKEYVYVPMDSATLADGELKIPFYTLLKLNVKSKEVIPEVKRQIEDLGFKSVAVADTVTDTDRIFQAIQLILSAFGAVALIVSAIGMFNTMTIALLERTQEIGIMKALGASRQDIWKLFLAESVIIGFLGGMGGILIGYIGTYAAEAGINFLAKAYKGQQVDIFSTPIGFVIFIIVFSTTVGLITGLYPAKRASRLNPLEALRYK